MIKSWKHKGLKQFYEAGLKSGIQAKHTKRLKLILQLLNRAISPEDIDIWNLGFHALKGGLKGFFSVKVSGNWRVIFSFEGTDVILVDYLDYH